SFGEPSIGVDPRTDAVMYQAGLYTMKAVFDKANPAGVTWTDVSSVYTNQASEDAILDVDRATGRTFVSQLALACSISAYSDDDGATWTPATKACQTPPAVDHQTIGAGPFAPPLTGTVYPNAVYYCSQNIAYAACALSLDGGLNYTQGLTPMYTSAQCFGIHGHVKVGPDGAVYVPDKACGAPECQIITNAASPNCHAGFVVSKDNGVTWTVHTIADGRFRYHNTGDPQVAIGPAGSMYFAYGDRDGHPKVAVCTNDGTTCSSSVDVGTAFHIENTEMATVVVGDDNRAAFAFLGSTMPGDDQQNNVDVTDASGKVINAVHPWQNFTGTWHLYVAVTYDHGQHWTTTDATPDHPVERGCIEFNAALCPSSRGSDDQRNLLDFNDLTIDAEGRVLAAYTDGCQPDLGPPTNHGTCLADATRLSGLDPQVQGPAVARQTCGPSLYAKYDAVMPSCVLGAATQPAPPKTASLTQVNTSTAPPPRHLAAGVLIIVGLLVSLGVVVRPRRQQR
ncbi:MAG: sialidase family protein, partial [Candidatus Dormibacteria bacterium]